jgi:hypothetical protein
VRQAAQRVLAELRKFRPDATLLDPDALATDYATLGTNHVICVGQWADNPVLRMTWGHWANSRAQRDWQAKGERRARELTDLWPRDIPAQAWRWQHDFFAFGYGDFDGADVAYVQTVRNPFPLLLRAVPGQTVYNTAIPRPYDRPPANQTYFVTDLTGTGPAGVVQAPAQWRAAGRGPVLARRLEPGRAGTKAVGRRDAGLGTGGGAARRGAIPGAADARQPSLWRVL